MKALSLTQPMAWAIFHGKDVENRKWPTKFRGRIRIHASRGFDEEHYQWLLGNDNRLCTGGVPPKEEFVHGALIGEVDIVECISAQPGLGKSMAAHGSRWFFGPYGFVLSNAVEYKTPIPCRGMLGFFEPQITINERISE